MSCNCKTSSCEPCAFCTPPGVTCLTTCEPIDPCNGETIDLCCVLYSGEDHECSGINNGEPICDIIFQILAILFPPEICCLLEGTIEVINNPTTTTSTTTSTTTTTTVLPCTIYTFEMGDPTGCEFEHTVFEFTTCGSFDPIQITVLPFTTEEYCVNNLNSVTIIEGCGSFSNTTTPCNA
jgi:hypothetical protein